MLKHCHATAIEHRRGNSQRSLKSNSTQIQHASDNSSLNSSSSSSSNSSTTGSVNCSFVGSETSASSSFVLASPVSVLGQTVTSTSPVDSITSTSNRQADSRRSSYSSPEPLSMASRTSSYASLSTTDGSLIHGNGKTFFTQYIWVQI